MKNALKWTELKELCWTAILEELPSISRGDLKSAKELIDPDRHAKAFQAADFLDYYERVLNLGKDAEADKYVGDPDEVLSNFSASFAALWWREPAVIAQSMVDEENLKRVLKDNPFVTFEHHLIAKAQVMRLDQRASQAETILIPLFDRLLVEKDSAFVNAGWLLAEIQFERGDDEAAVSTLRKMVAVLELDKSKINIVAETLRRMKPLAQV